MNSAALKVSPFHLHLDIILWIISCFITYLFTLVFSDMTQVIPMKYWLKYTVPELREIVTNGKTFTVLNDFSVDRFDK